jgi:hypothetical protein
MRQIRMQSAPAPTARRIIEEYADYLRREIIKKLRRRLN